MAVKGQAGGCSQMDSNGFICKTASRLINSFFISMGIIHLLVANGTFGLSCYLLCICNLCICICAFVLVYLHLCICTCVFVFSKQDSWVESFSTHPLGRLCRLKLPLNQSELNHPLTRMVTVEKGEM